jgi:hypothetical protein
VIRRSLPLVLVLAFAAGCGARPEMQRDAKMALPAGTPATAESAPDKEAEKKSDEPGAPAAPSTPREEPKREAASSTTDAITPQRDTSKIIYTARFTMAVSKVDESLATVERIARDQGGFLAQKHDREIVVRVPREKFEITMAAIGTTGDVLHRDIQALDVTEEVVDLEIRIKNAHAMQDRLSALLQKAPVKEAIEIEKELNRVTQELELLEGKIKVLKDRIAYSTITVAFEPRTSSVQATRAPLPFPWLKEVGLPSLLTLSEEKSQ